MNLLSLSQPLQLNPDVSAFQRKFVNEVRRCDEMDRKLSEFKIFQQYLGVSVGFDHYTEVAKPVLLTSLTSFEHCIGLLTHSVISYVNVNRQILIPLY